MEIYKTKHFGRIAAKALIDDGQLAAAIRRVEDGVVDATLGKHLLKLRVARTGAGRSGGFRTVVVYVEGNFCLFVHAFAKNRHSDLSVGELDAYREVAKQVASLEKRLVHRLVATGEWVRIEDGR